MRIREAIGRIRAAKPKRQAVQVNSQAAANAVKRRWAMEDAIRDTNARVNFLAEHTETLVQEVAADAVAKGVADGIATAERRAAMVAQRNHEADRHREKLRDDCRKAHAARVAAADKIRKAVQDENYQVYKARYREWCRTGTRLVPPHDLPESQYAHYFANVRAMVDAKHADDPDCVIDLLSDEHDEQNARNSQAYNDAVAESEELLKAQLAAIDRGEKPPVPGKEYSIIHHNDGTTTIWGTKLANAAAFVKFFEAEAASYEFDGETVSMYGLDVPVADIFAHKAKYWCG